MVRWLGVGWFAPCCSLFRKKLLFVDLVRGFLRFLSFFRFSTCVGHSNACLRPDVSVSQRVILGSFHTCQEVLQVCNVLSRVRNPRSKIVIVMEEWH